MTEIFLGIRRDVVVTGFILLILIQGIKAYVEHFILFVAKQNFRGSLFPLKLMVIEE
jgi:hypothetical protein